jgi:hypothetical protein
MCREPLKDEELEDDHTAENESVDKAQTLNEHVITVKSVTWKNDSHSLFDNKADEEKLAKKEFSVRKNDTIYRQGANV